MMNLGLVANSKRTIRSGAEYNGLFTEKAQGKEITLLEDGNVYDTLVQMQKIVDATLGQTKAIAKKLEGGSLEATCRNIWNFLYYHVQYKKDHPLREQLRTPVRTWKDRTSGVDCDCYSIFISSVLTNLNIGHSFRMAGYKGDFQHVYVIVPNGNSHITIDPVVNQFNHEATFSKKHDRKMKVTALNGLGECNTKPEILRLRKFQATHLVVANGGVPAKEFFDSKGIQYAPAFDNDNDQSVYVVSTTQGLVKVPTVLTPEQAEQISSIAGNCASAAPAPAKTSEDLKAIAKKYPWLAWLAIAVGGWVLFSGSDQNEVKSGLDGFGKHKRKKLKVISI
jgi:hypothetical protein